MPVDAFTIHLDKSTSQYSSGENITGKLFIQVSTPESATEVTIRFFGLAHTYWVYHHRHYNHSRDRYVYDNDDYVGHEVLFEGVVRLLGDGKNGFSLPQGQTVLPFAVQVPMRPLPATCSFQEGYVTYGVEGCIKNPWEADTKTGIYPLSILTIVDLNITPGAAYPVEMVDCPEFNNSCCSDTEPCRIRTFTPRLGFTAGEVIPLLVEIQNKTDAVLTNFNATLVQVWTLFATEDSLIPSSLLGGRETQERVHRIPLVAAVRGQVNPGEDIKWDVDLQIPLTTAPTLSPEACDIIKMEYVIEVVGGGGDGGCCGSSESFQILHPIIVGTVPLVAPAVATVQTPAYNETGGLA